MLQISDKMKQELHKEAVTNGLNEAEYKKLLSNVDELITNASLTSKWYRTGEDNGEYEA